MQELMQRVNNDANLAKILLKKFYTNHQEIVQKLQNYEVTSKEFDDALHGLKGLSGNLAMTKLFALTKTLYENRAEAFRKEHLAELIETIEAIFSEISKL
jgi:HPt (histidine-containing phosphotransfer) domain-containing protein